MWENVGKGHQRTYRKDTWTNPNSSTVEGRAGWSTGRSGGRKMETIVLKQQ